MTIQKKAVARVVFNDGQLAKVEIPAIQTNDLGLVVAARQVHRCDTDDTAEQFQTKFPVGMHVDIAVMTTITPSSAETSIKARRKPSIADVRRKLEEVEPMLVGHQDGAVYKHAIILMASLVVGNDISDLTHFTGYPKQFIQQIHSRMQEAELWVKDQIRCEHWGYGDDENIFDVDFWVDVQVAYGSWVRYPGKDGAYEYEEIGREAWEEDLERIQ